MSAHLNKLILPGLVQLCLMSSAYAQFTGELLDCPKLVGETKTECKRDVLLAESQDNVNFLVNYDYSCAYNLVASKPVIAVQTPGSPICHDFKKGLNLILEVNEAKQIHFTYSTLRSPVFDQACSLRIRSIVSRPSDSTIALWQKEAQRLTENLQNKSRLYSSIKDYESLVFGFSMNQLRGLQASMQRMFNEALELALTPHDAGPFDEAGPKSPADFGLNLSNWSELNLLTQELIILKPNSYEYMIAVDRMRHRWYFEAKDRLPIIPALARQMAVIAGALFLKERAQAEGFIIADSATLKTEVETAIADAQTFLNAMQGQRDLLQQQLDALLTAVNEANTGKQP